jgi:hypothetical protein
MYLVDEERGALALLLAALCRLGGDAAQFGHTGQHGVQGLEVGTSGVGNDHSESRLARARRAVEDERGKLVGLNGSPQEPARPDDVLLANVLVQGPGPQPGRQRLLLAGTVPLSEQRHGSATLDSLAPGQQLRPGPD